MLALDFLRVAFAWAVLVGVEVTRVGPPIIETVVTLQRHLIHSLDIPVLEVVVTCPSWLTADARRSSWDLRSLPPWGMAAPSRVTREG